MERQNIGARVRRARLARRLTLEEASSRVPCSVSHLNDIEHGRRRPSVDMIAGIARALEVSADYLLGLDELSPTVNVRTEAAHANPPPEGVDLEEWEQRARARLDELIEDVRRDWEETKRRRGR